MKKIWFAVGLCLAGCAHPPGSLEAQAETLQSADIEAAIRAAKPGQPRCDDACRTAAVAPPRK